MWSELEDLIQSHSDTSPQHGAILQILLNCKPASSGDDGGSYRKRRSTTDSRITDSKPGTPSSEM